MNKKMSIFIISLVLLISLSALSATDDTDLVANESTDLDNDVLSEDTTSDDTTYDVSDYDEFTEAINEIKNSSVDQEYTVNLHSNTSWEPYESTGAIVWGNVNATQIVHNLTINGNGLTVDLGGDEFIFVCEGYTVTLTNITLINGATEASSALVNDGLKGIGGAISNNGTLTLDHVIIADCNATSYGGAIFSSGNLTILNSIFDSNNAVYDGGVIANNGFLQIINSTFNNNYAQTTGVILNIGGNVSISRSSFTNNSEGAIYNRIGYLYVTQCNFTTNSDDSNVGGAILNAGQLVVTDSIFTDNSAEQGDAIYNYDQTGFNVTMELYNNTFISEVDTPVNESVLITVPVVDELYSSETQENVTYTIDSEEYNVTKTNGEVSLNHTFDTLGQYTVNVNYDANNTYIINVNVLNKVTIIVDDIPTQIVYTNTNITGIVVDKDNNPVSGIVVTGLLVTDVNMRIDEAVTDENGSWSLNFTFDGAGEYMLVIVTDSDDTYNSSELDTTFDVRRINTDVFFNSSTIDVLYDIMGNPYSITINVTDEYGAPVTEGSVAIKINDKTYTDTTGEIVYADVVNGSATFDLYSDDGEFSIGTYNITALYYGSSTYRTAKSTENLTFTINPCYSIVEVADIGYTPKSGDTITLVAFVYLTDDMGYNIDAYDGSVAFKINGVTLKDENGNPIKVEVNENGIAILEYTIPVDMAAKDYVITAVYGGSIGARSETNITMTIVKSDVIANIDPIYITQGENATITMTLYDQNNNQLERSTKYTVKVNGKTYVNKALTENGVLSVTLDTDDFTNTYYNITIILGENSAYNTKVINTVLIVDPSKNSTKVE
ncbi:MAG: hypothetical protein LUG89_05070 [Methanosphaera sp.]|nr:hypothetical protein [Methanosphaera sp.]